MIKLKTKVRIDEFEYVLVCDYYIPNFHFWHEGVNIGYYGNKRLKYLIEHNPQKLIQLKEQKALTNHLLMVNEKVISKKDELIATMSMQESTKENDSKLPWKKTEEEYLKIELLVLSQFVYA